MGRQVVITTFALIRLIPYLLVAYLAWRKGFPRLAALALYMMIVAITVYVFSPSQDIRAIMGASTALLLLWHTADLKRRN